MIDIRDKTKKYRKFKEPIYGADKYFEKNYRRTTWA